METQKMIYKSLADIQDRIVAIAKDRKNNEQNFKFRSIDDVYNLVFPLFRDNRVITIPKVIESSTDILMVKKSNGQEAKQLFAKVKVQYELFSEDGSSVTGVTEGQALDFSDKAMNKAMSFAHKLFLIQMFNIPVENMDDGDNDSPEVGSEKSAISDARYVELKDALDKATTRPEVTKIWNDNISLQKDTSFRDLVSKRLNEIKQIQQ